METIIRKPTKISKLLEFLGIKTNYKILLDESISHVPKEERDNSRIWLECIPAHEGIIYLNCASPIELAFFSESIHTINAIKNKLGDSVKIIKMDGEGIVYFKPNFIKEIFKLAKVKRRRTIKSNEEKIT